MLQNKYLVFFLQNIHETLVYKVRLAIIIISSFIAPLVAMFVLSNLPGKQINGMSREQIITYYLSTSILFLFMNSKIDNFVKGAIQHGELAVYLIKPVNFWLIALIKDISQRIIKLIFGLPIFVMLLIIYSQSFKINSESFELTLLMILISFLIAFTSAFCLGLLTLWVEEVWGLQNVKEVAIIFFGGVALPYSFFPETLQKALVYTPFPYLINWPLRPGFSGSLRQEFIISFFWLIIFLLLNIYLWKKGVRKYSALGTY